MPLPTEGPNHDAELGPGLGDRVLHLAQDRAAGGGNLDAVLLHFRVDALGVVEDVAHGHGLSEVGVGNLEEMKADGVARVSEGRPAALAAINRLFPIPNAAHLGGDGLIGLPDDPINQGLVEASKKGGAVLSGALLGQDLGLQTEEPADILADLIQHLLVHIIVDCVAQLQQASEGGNEIAVRGAPDANVLEGSPEVIGGSAVVGSGQVRGGVVRAGAGQEVVAGGALETKELTLGGGGGRGEEVVEGVEGTVAGLGGDA